LGLVAYDGATALGYNYQTVNVLDWLKASPSTKPKPLRVIWVNAEVFDVPRSFLNNDTMILFLDEIPPCAGCDARATISHVAGGLMRGSPAVFTTRDGRIVTLDYPQYQGWAVADFEAAIRAALPPTPTATAIPPTPTVTPTAIPWPLAKLVQQADAIVALRWMGGTGLAGFHQTDFAVQHWLKQPERWDVELNEDARNWLALTQSTASVPVGVRNRPTPTTTPEYNREKDDIILFLQWCKDEHIGMNSFCAITGDGIGAFTTHNGKIESAGIPQYQGWAVAEFEAEIRALLAHPELGASVFPH
jgi:hypothetical protein